MNGYTLKILGILLDYPTPLLLAESNTFMALLQHEKWLSSPTLEALENFMDNLSRKELFDAQEEYVALFDRTPSLSLHLFEHVYGDSRDRGQALVELDSLYREEGLFNNSEHTPDYLPLFLEYLSLLSVEKAQETLDGAIDVIAIVGERLKKRQSGYAALFDALREASSCNPDMKKLKNALIADSGRSLTLDEIDQAWEEQFAFADIKNERDCLKADEICMKVPTMHKEARQ